MWIVGAILAGMLTGAMPKVAVSGLDPGGFIWTVLAATLGAVIPPSIYRPIRHKTVW